MTKGKKWRSGNQVVHVLGVHYYLLAGTVALLHKSKISFDFHRKTIVGTEKNPKWIKNDKFAKINWSSTTLVDHKSDSIRPRAVWLNFRRLVYFILRNDSNVWPDSDFRIKSKRTRYSLISTIPLIERYYYYHFSNIGVCPHLRLFRRKTFSCSTLINRIYLNCNSYGTRL